MKISWLGLAAGMLACLALSLVSCGSEADQNDANDEDAAGSRLSILATCHPMAYLSDRVAGDVATVTVPLPANADPATWAPDDAALANLRAADLIVANGAEFEEWLATTALPESRVLRTAQVFASDWLKYEKVFTHRHGPGGEHSHAGVDGHTWLDPLLAKKQAEAIRDALIRIRPEEAEGFRRRFDALAKDLDGLDARFREISPSERKDSPWWVSSHPAYNYPARRYGWRLMNLDLDPGSVPADADLAEMKHGAEDHGARFLVWESTPDAEVARKIEETTGLKSVVVSPAEMVSGDETYLNIMRRNAEVLREVLAR